MEEKETRNINAFDTLFTTNRIQILKTLLPHLSTTFQKGLAIYIKISELQYTIHYFKQHTEAIFPQEKKSKSGFSEILEDILPLCSSSDVQKLKGVQSTFQSIENMQEMIETLQMLQEVFPEGDNPFSSFKDKSLFPFDLEQLMELLQMDHTDNKEEN